ncbi:MAG: tRNA 2-thiouridine(34) synthase MnmA [Dehalococcoidales bacterium]
MTSRGVTRRNWANLILYKTQLGIASLREKIVDKVAVAMSGGIDSSVAAALLKERGYQVTGVTMRVGTGDKADTSPDAAPAFINDARRVADALGIPHHVFDLRDIFHEKVIAPFCQEYRAGRTPNPCVLCNRYIKFDALLDKARSLGAGCIATGHHARVTRDDGSGRVFLRKGRDRQKDQSYFLYALTQEQLRHAMFPIGHLTKEEVRTEARERNLPTGSRPESQDICFIPNNDYADFLKGFLPQTSEPGPILDEHGNILGRHRGIVNYTIGQRKRLGIAAGEPQYVIAIEPEHNAVIVGNRERALGDELTATRVNWSAIARPTEAITARAKIRYRHPEAEVTVTPVDKDSVSVKFKEPQLAITPGQSIVFYNGDKVLSGGTITVSSKLMAPEPAKEYASNG